MVFVKFESIIARMLFSPVPMNWHVKVTPSGRSWLGTARKLLTLYSVPFAVFSSKSMSSFGLLLNSSLFFSHLSV